MGGGKARAGADTAGGGRCAIVGCCTAQHDVTLTPPDRLGDTMYADGLGGGGPATSPGLGA